MRRRLAQAILLATTMLLGAFAGEALKPTEYLADLKPRIALETDIPRIFLDWKEDLTIVPILPNPDVQAALDRAYSATLARTYINASGQRVMLSIAYGSDQSSETTYVHRPEQCYGGNGFEISNLGEDKVDVGGRRLAVRRLLGVRGQRRETITYWITIDNIATLPGIGRRLEQISFGLKGQIPDGLLFRISSVGMSEAASFKLHEQFLKDLFGTLHPLISQRYFGA